MHDTALELGAEFFRRYLSPSDRILELGSADVNGGLRDLVPDGDRPYVGADFEAGPGVDVVVRPGEPLPFGDGEFSVVVSSSALEHDAAFWETFPEICRVTAPGGLVYLNVPSNGHHHAHPLDCWRFYPDAGLALERLARKAGHDVSLVESFTWERNHGPGAGEWNDCVSIFAKAGAERALPEPIASSPRAVNARLRGVPELLRPEPFTEDQRKARRAEIAAIQLSASRAREDALAVREGAPFFTIVAAYYQGCTSDAEFHRFLASLSAQRYRNFEVLLMHDGPMLRKIECPYPIFQSEERTAFWGHDLRATALGKARGLYVLHTNADNEYAPDALESLHEFLSNHPIDVVTTEVEMMGLVELPSGGHGYPAGERDPSKSLRLRGDLPMRGRIDLMQLCARRSLWLEYGFPGRDTDADGHLYERICAERGFAALPILVGRHW